MNVLPQNIPITNGRDVMALQLLRGLGLRRAVFGGGQQIVGVDFTTASHAVKPAAEWLITDDPRIVSVGVVQHPLGGFALRVARDLRNPNYRPELDTIEGVPLLYQNQYDDPLPLTRKNRRPTAPCLTSKPGSLTSGHDVRNAHAEPDDFGTVTFFVPGDGTPNRPSLMVSNNHVMRGQCRSFARGESIVRPSDSCSVVGALHRCVPIVGQVRGPFNTVDIGIAIVSSQTQISHSVDFSIDVEPLKVGETVRVLGAVNHNVKTQVEQVPTIIAVYYDQGFCWFEEVIKLAPVTDGGDSGAAIVRDSTGELAGIIFSGDESGSYGFPISSLKAHWNELVTLT